MKWDKPNHQFANVMKLLNKFTNIFPIKIKTENLILRCIIVHNSSKRGKLYTKKSRIIGVRPLSFSENMKTLR